MARPSKQIGWSQEANLYYELLKQLERLTAVMSNVTLEPVTTTSTTTIFLPVVTICGLEWTTENLDVSTYRNGDPIPQVTDPTEWAALTTGAWCYYNNDPANGAIYGKLYNWYALTDPRGLAPAGYRLITDAEYLALRTCLQSGVPLVPAGGSLKEAGTVHWAAPNDGATNITGFTALPGGTRSFGFSGITTEANFWTSAEFDATRGISYRIVNFLPSFNRGSVLKFWGGSVRLVKD
jgi:uncharacterized protein (TIGR02145 family)